MTAIAIIYTTPGGFILAADGRVTHPVTHASTDEEAQKIFEVKCDQCRLAYSVSGDVLDDDGYDLRIEVDKHTQLLCAADCNGFDDYCRRLGTALTAEINKADKANHLAAPQTQESEPIIIVNLAGYYKDKAVWTTFSFTRQPCGIMFTHNANTMCNGNACIHGGKIAPDLAISGDPRFAKYRFYLTQNLRYITLGGAANYAKAFIACCSCCVAQEIDPDCKRIGGLFHMLEITKTNGFNWLNPHSTEKGKGNSHDPRTT